MKINYFVIQDWMVSDLKLKGCERDVYAIIYGFSQDCQTQFFGSLNYLAEITGYSKQAVITALKSLVDKELLVKHTKIENNVKVCTYSSNLTSSQETLPGGSQVSLPGGSQETLLNNIINNKYINTINSINNNTEDVINDYENHGYSKEDFLGSVKQNKKSRGKTLFQKCQDETCLFTDNVALQTILNQYLELRLKMTDRPMYGVNQWKGILNKLLEMNEEDSVLIKVVNQSLEHGWASVYPIKQTTYTKKEVFSEYGEVTSNHEEDEIVDEEF